MVNKKDNILWKFEYPHYLIDRYIEEQKKQNIQAKKTKKSPIKHKTTTNITKVENNTAMKLWGDIKNKLAL